jgi:hypothetical protein
MDTQTNSRLPGDQWGKLPGTASKIVPTAAVVTVVVAAVATTLVVTYSEHDEASRPSAVSLNGQDVVRAPPLVVQAPRLTGQAQASKPAERQAGKGTVASNAMGAGPSCSTCGVVESVAANGRGAFQMRIRMDDGSMRTVEQRGAMAAGSRVVLEGSSVRAAPGSGQG